MRRSGWFVVLIAALFAACTKDAGEVPATALIVRVSAEQELQSTLRSVRLRTSGAQGQAWALRSDKTFQAEALHWPIDLVLVPSSGWTLESSLEIVIDALDASGKPLAQTRVLTSFVEQQTRIVTMPLARCGAMALGELCETNPDCYGPSCRTCVQASCQQTPMTSATDLPALVPDEDAGAPPPTGDAASPVDAGSTSVPMDATTLDAAPVSPSPGMEASVLPEASAIEGVDASHGGDTGVSTPVDDSGGLGQPEAAPCIASAEVCDGKDNDCDGDIDEQVKTRCWADNDSDGFAAQNASVMESCDQCGAKQTSVAPGAGKIDCDDADAKKSPGATDICGDKLDNDCDGMTDEESNNACNGPCTTPLPGRPGEACSNGLKGACARTGVYECAADRSMRCTAANVAGTSEVCGDNSDNDCDGTVDNGCVKNACGGWSKLANAKGAACSAGSGSCASSGTYQCQGTDATVCNATPKQATAWYVDCDKDSFAASTVGQTSACGKPALSGGCDWTATQPTGSNIDCDNNNAARYPGANYGLVPSGADPDLNCDNGVSRKLEFVASNSALFTSSSTYNLCTRRIEQLTSATCNCWYTSTVMWGFTHFTSDGPQGAGGHTIPWLGGPSGVEAAPCAEASNNVGILILLTWDSSAGICTSVTNDTVALRTMCK